MKKPFVLHPFLFAVAPIVFLFAHNVEELEFSDIRPLFFVLIFSSVLFLLSFLALRHKQKAGLFTSILLIIFFSYGHFSEILKYPKIDVGGLIIKSNTIIFSIYILVILVTLFLIKKYKNFDNVTKSLNVMASILILVSLANIAYYKITALDLKQASKGTEDLKTENVDFSKPATPSNIFYIIVDGYGRQDIIKEFYDYGNSEFIDYLKKSGFYVASKSKSNYHSTNLSLPSSLNFDYLNVLPKPDYRSALMNNNVFKLMKQQGYETIVISSGDFTNKIKKADVYLAYSKALTDFENEVLNLTPIPFFLRKLSRFAISKSIVDQYSMHREKVNYVFDALADISKSKKPIFVYAYICSPHPPFVFGPNGEKVESGSKFVINDTGNFNASHSRGRYVYTKGYANQLKYINKKLMSTLDIILSTNKNPIIIIQGDHGPRSIANWEKPDETCWKECYSILNAYHLPNNGNDNLYNSITPVNTFRIISNHYFGTSYKLLEDRSYFYRKGTLIDVTDKVDSDAACVMTFQQ